MRYDIYSGVKRAKTKMQKIALVFMALALPVALALSTGGGKRNYRNLHFIWRCSANIPRVLVAKCNRTSFNLPGWLPGMYLGWNIYLWRC